jgi:predicted peroxiredoxin
MLRWTMSRLSEGEFLNAEIIISGTCGPSDPTRASMPFHIAKGAREAGYDVGVVLANDAPFLMKDYVRDAGPRF